MASPLTVPRRCYSYSHNPNGANCLKEFPMSNEQVSITEIEKQVLEAFKEGDIVEIADLMKKDVQTDNDNQFVIYTDQFLLGSRSL